MPKNELKILFENIKNLRRLLSEGVGNSSISNAIDERKYIYIYYAGDKTILKGYRTILPMVLGENANTGNRLLRAWQVNGSSDSKKTYLNKKQKTEYGWRLFNVDKIVSFLPTGKTVDENKLPPSFNSEDYNPNDSQMTSIITAMEINANDINYDSDADATKIKVSGSTFDTQTPKFKQFFKAAAKTREATAEEIKVIYDRIKRYTKESPAKTLVVQNEKGDMVTRNINQKEKLPPESIVGVLSDLYNELVLPTLDTNNIDLKQANIVNNSFIEQQRNSLK